MRRVLIATAAVVVLFAVGAFAAQFTLNSEDIASGADKVDKCADVSVDFVPGAYSETDHDWPVSKATLTFTTTNCGGGKASIEVSRTSGAPVAGGPIDIATGATTVDIPLSGLLAHEVVSAAVLVDGVHLSPSAP